MSLWRLVDSSADRTSLRTWAAYDADGGMTSAQDSMSIENELGRLLDEEEELSGWIEDGTAADEYVRLHATENALLFPTWERRNEGQAPRAPSCRQKLHCSESKQTKMSNLFVESKEQTHKCKK